MKHDIMKKRINIPLWFIIASYGWLIWELAKENKTAKKSLKSLSAMKKKTSLESEKNKQLKESLTAYEQILQDEDLLDSIPWNVTMVDDIG